LVISVPVGVAAARRPGGALDLVAGGISFFGVSLPAFWFGLMLSMFLSVQLGLLPSAGMYKGGRPSRWRRSFLDRARSLSDPRFQDVPGALCLSKDRPARLRARIERRDALDEEGGGPPESPHTTPVNVADGEGHGVSLTHTLGSASGVVPPGLGFPYNHCLSPGDPLPGRPNSIRPGKARITGMSPAIVFGAGRTFLGAGAPGGTRSLGAVTHPILNVVDHGMTAVEAVSAPRWPWEAASMAIAPRLDSHVRDARERWGLTLGGTPDAYDGAFARAHAILIDPASGRLHGTADPRGGGVASA
jgi:gamma-glutamyltranspeptidase/glutathione hydrolase